MAETVTVLTPRGDVSVARIAELQEHILDAFKRYPKVVLNLSRIERIDLAFVHLLYAAKREAESRGVVLRLNGRLSREPAELLQRGGFCKQVPANGQELEQALVEFEG